MKTHLLLVLGMFSLAPAVGPVLCAQPKTEEKAPSPPKKEDKEETELETKMEKLDRAWKKLRKQAGDPASNASSLELVATIRQASEESAKLTPARAEDVSAADRAKFVADYQEKMKTFLAELDKLAVALKENRNEDAVKQVAKLNSFQREAHREFRRPR